MSGLDRVARDGREVRVPVVADDLIERGLHAQGVLAEVAVPPVAKVVVADLDVHSDSCHDPILSSEGVATPYGNVATRAIPRSWRIPLAYDKIPLSLNDRTPWQVRAREVRNLRDRVRQYTRHLQIPRLDAIHVEMLWTPKTRRTRDLDNLVATLKPAIDGLRDYPERHRTVDGVRRLVSPAWVGVVPDDDPQHVTWARPALAEPNRDPFFTDRLVFIVTERTPDNA